MSHRALTLGLTLFCLILSVPAARSQQTELDRLLDREMPSLLSTYKALHAAPELSYHEEKTSSLVPANCAPWDTPLPSASANTPTIRTGSVTAWWEF